MEMEVNKIVASQESAESHQTATSAGQSASNAEDDLTIHHKKAFRATTNRGGPKRRSERLKQGDPVVSGQSLPTAHGYNTRSQPLTEWQLRKALGKAKQKSRPKTRAPWKSGFQPRKNSKGPGKKVEEEREARRQERLKEAEEMLANLDADDPLDDISWDFKKRLASYWVLKRYYQGRRSGQEVTKQSLMETASDLLDVSFWSVLQCCMEYELNRGIAASKRGKHSKTVTPIYDADYEDFRGRLRAFIKENSLGAKGKPNLTIKKVTEWVNDDLGLKDGNGYSERTVGDWMHYLGFGLVLVKKTLYIDGHERDDVIADRERLGRQLDELKPKLLTIDDDSLLIRPNPAAEFILISQDEKIHHSNDVQRRYWSDKTFSKLPSKSQGRTVMTSDFLSEIYGFVKYSESDLLVPGERTGAVLDVTVDGYYNSERCQVDFEECSEAVASLTAEDGQRLHCAFLTDRSPIHCKYPEDGLNARSMNVKPGGRQPRMRDGWFWSHGEKKVQKMVFPSSHPLYPNLPKGLREVCRERFGDSAISGKRHEELLDMLSGCDDFKSQKTILEEQAEARGDVVVYGVKFHPELAPIEAAYRSIAKSLRVSNTPGSSKGFVERVEAAQGAEDLTIELIRKHFRSAREYLQHYREGKTMEEIEKLRAQKRKHRGAAPGLRVSPERSQKGKYPRNRLG